MKIIRPTSKILAKIFNRSYSTNKRIQNKVTRIVDDIRLHGDEAVIKYTRIFDKIKLTPRTIKVSQQEMNAAHQNINPAIVSSLRAVMDNIYSFHQRQVRKSWKMKLEDNVMLGEVYRPLDSVGIYIPSGTVPLISTVYMTVIPAKIAGVKEIFLLSPPNKYGTIDPYILTVANLLKVNAIYKTGGAQAIAALAFGTKTIPKVDKIVGPGNIYVTEAKRQVFGYVDIDMVAGPTEVVIIADKYANPEFIITDLKAQSEHAMGVGVLITTSKTLAKIIKKERSKGYIIVAKNLDEAVQIANSIAPEHLQIMTINPKNLIKKVTNAGAIFIGPYTPTSVGDYVAGPSHVLPTGGTAKFFSGLGVSDFIKRAHIISYSKKALEKVKDSLQTIAEIEGLKEHSESVKVRFK